MTTPAAPQLMPEEPLGPEPAAAWPGHVLASVRAFSSPGSVFVPGLTWSPDGGSMALVIVGPDGRFAEAGANEGRTGST